MLTLCFVVPRARARNWRCWRSSIDSLFFWLAQRRCKYLVLKTLSLSRTPSPFVKLWYCATADCLDSLIFQRKFNNLISTKPCVLDCRSSFLPLSNSPYCINNRSIYREVVNKMFFFFFQISFRRETLWEQGWFLAQIQHVDWNIHHRVAVPTPRRKARERVFRRGVDTTTRWLVKFVMSGMRTSHVTSSHFRRRKEGMWNGRP